MNQNDPNNPYSQQQGYPQQQQYGQQQGYAQYPQQQGYPQQQYAQPPAKKGASSPGLLVVGILLLLAGLVNGAYAGILFRDWQSTAQNVKDSEKMLKSFEDQDNEKDIEYAKNKVKSYRKSLDEMEEQTVKFGAIAGGLVAFGILFMVLGGRNKKA